MVHLNDCKQTSLFIQTDNEEQTGTHPSLQRQISGLHPLPSQRTKITRRRVPATARSHHEHPILPHHHQAPQDQTQPVEPETRSYPDRPPLKTQQEQLHQTHVPDGAVRCTSLALRHPTPRRRPAIPQELPDQCHCRPGGEQGEREDSQVRLLPPLPAAGEGEEHSLPTLHCTHTHRRRVLLHRQSGLLQPPLPAPPHQNSPK
jgi:hypothetical protein